MVRQSPSVLTRTSIGSAERSKTGGVRDASSGRRSALRVSAANRVLWLVVVPGMLFASSMLMALAWLGHLKFKHLPFTIAVMYCWLLVLPEYLLNISAIRLGYGVYSGAQMASFRLCSGVACVAIVSRFVLGENFTPRDILGFTLMVASMVLIAMSRSGVRRIGDSSHSEERGSR